MKTGGRYRIAFPLDKTGRAAGESVSEQTACGQEDEAADEGGMNAEGQCGLG
jgi:hypothetical protein